MMIDQIFRLNFVRSFVYILYLPIFLFGCNVKSEERYKEFIRDGSLCDIKNEKCDHKERYVKLETSKGDLIFRLDMKNAPLTSANFLDLVQKGIYDQTTFHRVVNDPEPFFIQGGDPYTRKKIVNKSKVGIGSYIDKRTGKIRYIPLEIKLINEELPRYNKIVNDPAELKRLILTHDKGSIAMARLNHLNSASAQFFIALKPLPELDGRYAVFGKIVKGMKILQLINENDYLFKAKEIDSNFN